MIDVEVLATGSKGNCYFLTSGETVYMTVGLNGVDKKRTIHNPDGSVRITKQIFERWSNLMNPYAKVFEQKFWRLG